MFGIFIFLAILFILSLIGLSAVPSKEQVNGVGTVRVNPVTGKSERIDELGNVIK